MENSDILALPIGTILNSKYRIQKHLSSGGFGKTYLAEYGSNNKKFAIKEFFMNTANQREADGVTVSVDMTKENADAFDSQLAKFKKEYERLKQISNVHVVKVHECFEENGTAYYVMDFVEGADLKRRLEQRGVPYAEKTVLNYMKQILDGLSSIHSVGLLHLDIKPSNIMVDMHGNVKLIDLGASKDYMQGVGASVYSSMARTNRYAPPEQMDGSYDKLGPWSDFYALGATMYYLLTRHEIPTWTEIFEDRSSDKHTALPMLGISQETKSLVIWLMNTDRDKRPRSVKEILTRMISKKAEDVEVQVIPDDKNEGTVLIGNPHKPQQTNKVSQQNESDPSEKDTGNGNPKQNNTQENEPEFSFVGCLYILIIIAIIVCVIKFLFFT